MAGSKGARPLGKWKRRPCLFLVAASQALRTFESCHPECCDKCQRGAALFRGPFRSGLPRAPQTNPRCLAPQKEFALFLEMTKYDPRLRRLGRRAPCEPIKERDPSSLDNPLRLQEAQEQRPQQARPRPRQARTLREQWRNGPEGQSREAVPRPQHRRAGGCP
jgi:hypothetical protein